MPSPKSALKGRNSDSGVTNIRNVKSPHRRRWLGTEHRCVVPFTSFSENEALPDTLNSRRPQRRRRALCVAGLRARAAVFVVPAAVHFVFAIFLLATFPPGAVVTVRFAAERFFFR